MAEREKSVSEVSEPAPSEFRRPPAGERSQDSCWSDSTLGEAGLHTSVLVQYRAGEESYQVRKPELT